MVQICATVLLPAGEYSAMQAEIKRLRDAIQKTLDENGHLADGDDCTLIHLVRVLETPNAGGNGQP